MEILIFSLAFAGMVEICTANEDYHILLFVIILLINGMVTDFVCSGFPWRGSARAMGNSCVTGGCSKDFV